MQQQHHQYQLSTKQLLVIIQSRKVLVHAQRDSNMSRTWYVSMFILHFSSKFESRKDRFLINRLSAH